MPRGFGGRVELMTLDYKLLTATVANGVVTELGSVTVPTLDESRLYYTDTASASANKSERVIGNLVQIRAEYDISDKYTTSG